MAEKYNMAGAGSKPNVGASAFKSNSPGGPSSIDGVTGTGSKPSMLAKPGGPEEITVSTLGGNKRGFNRPGGPEQA